MTANVLLVWFDTNIDEKNNTDCQNTITYLRYIVNIINIFTDAQECIQFLEDGVDKNVCMIISGSLGQQMMPRVHNLSQVDSIFVFIYEALKQAARLDSSFMYTQIMKEILLTITYEQEHMEQFI